MTSSFSKTKEPPKLVHASSSGMREGKFLSVNNFSAQEHALSKSRHILNFRVMAVRDKVMNVFVEKYILILGFLAILGVN